MPYWLVIDSAFGALTLFIGVLLIGVISLDGATNGTELPRFGMGSCVDFKSIVICSVEIVCQSCSDVGTVRGIVC